MLVLTNTAREKHVNIVAIAGMAPITKDQSASRALYLETLRLPLKAIGDYLSLENFEGAIGLSYAPWLHAK